MRKNKGAPTEKKKKRQERTTRVPEKKKKKIQDDDWTYVRTLEAPTSLIGKECTVYTDVFCSVLSTTRYVHTQIIGRQSEQFIE